MILAVPTVAVILHGGQKKGRKRVNAEQRGRWEAANRLINTVRQAKGLPLLPSYDEAMKKRNAKNT